MKLIFNLFLHIIFFINIIKYNNIIIFYKFGIINENKKKKIKELFRLLF